MVAAAWPGESTRGWFLPAGVASAVAVIAGPRAGMWQLAAWGASPIGEVIKRLFHRPRPLLGRFNPVGGRASGSSFPSTHVSNYAATFGLAIWILRRRRSRTALPVSALGLGLMGLVGPSRVITGDHRWSDVAAGYSLGVAYLAVVIAFAKRDRILGHRIARPSHPPRPTIAIANRADNPGAGRVAMGVPRENVGVGRPL